MFHLPDGATAAATKIHKLHHKLHEPARTVNIVPSLMGNSLLSTVKMVQAGYTAIYNNSRSIFTIPRQPRSVYQRQLSSLGTYALRLNFGMFPW
jgi:hypothetical protein